MPRFLRFAVWGGAGVIIWAGGSSAYAGITASSVVDYQPGAATSFTNPSAALGLPVGDTTFGALTPFNPPFKDSQIVIVGAGGHLTLQLSAAMQADGPGSEIGVFAVPVTSVPASPARPAIRRRRSPPRRGRWSV